MRTGDDLDRPPRARGGPAVAGAGSCGEAAALLAASRLSGSLLEGLPEALRPRTRSSALAIQRCAHRILEDSGFGRRVGWKIGCTTAVMQAYLGVDSPCPGGVFQASVWRARHRFELSSRRRLGVECEIAVRLASDLRGRAGSPYDERSVAGAVAACMAAIEVVEDRYVDYGAIDTGTLIADDFFNHSCVLGDEREDFDPARLVASTATMSVNGEEVGGGVGAEVLGDPLRALAWLANSAVEQGDPLLAGEIVLLGSLLQTRWVQAGDEVRIANRELGEVGAAFASAVRDGGDTGA